MTCEKTRRLRVPVAAHALLALMVGGTGGAAWAADAVNVIRAIEVGDGAQGTEIRVIGSREATFTVFKLAEPPRVVVDLSSTDLSGVDRLLEVGRGNVEAVLTTQFDDAGAKVGRVMVALQKDARYDVRASGRDVLISVAQPAEAPQAVAQATQPAATQPAAAQPAAEAESEEARPAPAEVAAAVPAPEAVAEVPAAPRAKAPAQRLPEGVVARKADRLEVVENPATRVLSVQARADRGQVHVRVRTDGQVPLVETLELADPPRLAIDLHGVNDAPRQADVRLPARASVESVRVGEHATKVRVVIDGRGSAMDPYEVDRTADGVLVTVGRRGSAPAVAKTAPRTSDRDLARIEALSFDRAGDIGRVVLAISNADGLDAAVSHPDRRTAVLTLTGARLDGQLEQTFDTSRLGGAVKAVTAFTDPGRSDRVKIVVSLSRPVTSKVVPMGRGLSWDLDLGSEGAEVASYDEAEEIPVVTAAGLSSEGAVHVTASAEQQRRSRYSGRRITLEFKEIDIHNVLRLIAEVSRRNIVVADDVSGSVTLQLRNVPWDQALDLILRSKGLDKEVMGNIIRIAPAETLNAEREARQKARAIEVELAPLHVRLVPVNFATASDMSGKVKDVLSERGSVTVDTRTNALIVKDVVEALARAEQLVRRLDTETPQVLIESRIVEANANFTRQIGVQWGGNINMSPAFGNPTGLVFPNIFAVAGAATDGQTPTSATSATPNFVVNMPAPIGTNSGGGLGFVFGSAGGAVNLNLRLSAMETEGVVKTISAPKVTTLDNAQASISQGLSIPFSQVSAAGVNTTFIQAKLQLDVTPHVTSDGSILMDISVTNNQPNPQLTGANGQPSISQKEAKTNVMVKDGETTVIGGIYTRQNSTNWTKVPGLSNIPIIGWMFKKKIYNDSRTELLVFITPRIINRTRTAAVAAP